MAARLTDVVGSDFRIQLRDPAPLKEHEILSRVAELVDTLNDDARSRLIWWLAFKYDIRKPSGGAGSAPASVPVDPEPFTRLPPYPPVAPAPPVEFWWTNPIMCGLDGLTRTSGVIKSGSTTQVRS